MEGDYLLLKWGTLKGWKITTDEARTLLRRYHEIGASLSCMAQKDTPEQKQIICDLIDCIDGDITNDWSGETYTKTEAKDYIRQYGKATP